MQEAAEPEPAGAEPAPIDPAAALPLGHIDATLRMEQRVLTGMPLRQAHHETAAELATRAAPVAADVAGLIGRYRTIGSASPAETRRIAAEMLAELQSV